jgi:hypothetical protein
MIPVEHTSTGTLVFLKCGCAGWRNVTHPTGAAALVQMIQPCKVHADERVRFLAVPKGETVRPWVQTPMPFYRVRAQ